MSVASGSPEDSTPEMLTNFDRLRAHLQSDGLARHLLDAWIAHQTKSAEDLLKDFEAFYESKEPAVAPAHQAD